jgi:hypothetical protein
MLSFKPDHVEKILSGAKTQTRRLWLRCRVRVGAIHPCVTRRFGAPFARVRITAVRQEPLTAISDDDVLREGYEDRAAYLLALENIYGMPLKPDVLVWVVDFELVDVDASPPVRQSAGRRPSTKCGAAEN